MILRTTVALAAVALVVAPAAGAHGTRHPKLPIRPAYDCFKYVNPETGSTVSTEGNVEIVHDSDLGVYVKWRCKCVKTTPAEVWPPKWHCWWTEVSRRKALRDSWVPSGPRWVEPRLRVRWVRWMAHTQIGWCHQHSARRGVLVVARRR